MNDNRFKTALAIPNHVLDDRCAPRNPVIIPAQLRSSGNRGFPVIVKDISLSGFACEGISTLRAGARCWLTLPNMEGLQAEVIRNDGILLGCAFANLLHQAVLDRISARFAQKPEKSAFAW
jgi:hypothetical protein